jgi:hypothetical protein
MDPIETAYQVTQSLFGPDSPVPWWAWAALLTMIFWGLLVPQWPAKPQLAKDAKGGKGKK